MIRSKFVYAFHILPYHFLEHILIFWTFLSKPTAGSFQSSPGELCLGHQLLGDTSQLQQGLLDFSVFPKHFFHYRCPSPAPWASPPLTASSRFCPQPTFTTSSSASQPQPLASLAASSVLRHRKENHQYLPKDRFSNRVLQRCFRGSSNVMWQYSLNPVKTVREMDLHIQRCSMAHSTMGVASWMWFVQILVDLELQDWNVSSTRKIGALYWASLCCCFWNSGRYVPL